MFKLIVVLVALCGLALVATAEKQDNPLACSVCQLVLNFVEQQVANNGTVDKIDALVTKICTTLHVSSWCQQNLLPLIPQIIQGLEQKEPPQVVCQQIKLCAPSLHNNAMLLAGKHGKGKQHGPKLGKESKHGLHHGKKHGKHMRVQANPLTCGLCNGIVSLVEKQIQTNASITVVDNLLLKVCGKLRVTNWCQSELIPKVSNILSMLVQKAPPAKICTAIKLCNPNATVVEEKKAVQQYGYGVKAEVEATNGLDLKCSICESIISFARQAAGSDKTMAGVQRAITAACGKIPFAKDVCNALLAPLVQKIAQDLLNNVDTHKICVNIKMCRN